MSFAEYVYKNQGDKVRVRIYKRLSGEWDYDSFFRRSGEIKNFAEEAGDSFATKRECKVAAEREHGKLRSLGNIRNVISGWK